MDCAFDAVAFDDVAFDVCATVTFHRGGALREYPVPITDNDDDLLLAAWFMFMTQLYEDK